MPTVRTAKHLLLESTTKSVESGTNDVICQFCTVKGMVVESEVLKAQNCALSKFSLPVHCNGNDERTTKTQFTRFYIVCPSFSASSRIIVHDDSDVKTMKDFHRLHMARRNLPKYLER